MKNSIYKAVSLTLCWTLFSCASTDEMMSSFNAKNVQKPLWLDEPLITGEQCDTLTGPNIQNFLLKYAQAEELEDVSTDAGLDALNTYTLASVLINRSQLCMSEALSLKSTTETLLKEKEILLSGTSMSKKEIAKHREYSEAASAEIKLATEQAASLEPEQKKTFVLGIATFLTGTVTTMKIKKALSNYVSKTKSAVTDTTQHAKSGNLDSAFDLVSNSIGSLFGNGKVIYDIMVGLPEHGQNLYQTGSFFFDYAKQQELDLSTDSTDEFLSTVSW